MPETGFPFWPPGPWFNQGGTNSQGTDVVSTDNIDAPFISSVTQVFAPTLDGPAAVSQIGVEVLEKAVPTGRVSQVGVEVVRTHTGAAVNAGVSQFGIEVLGAQPIPIAAPFISSNTVVYGVFSMFESFVNLGPGNGGEIFDIQLAPNGTSVVATLAASLSPSGSVLSLTGDSGLPSTGGFCLTIDSEVVYVKKFSAGIYTIVGREKSNTTAAAHSVGASAVWGDTYDQSIAATAAIGTDFTANISGTGATNYDGYLVAFDSTQAYISTARYPFRVTSFLGVFAAGAGSTGTNKTDGSQPAKTFVAGGISDNCPACLGYPAKISTGIDIGDVALVRYTNPEASILTLGSRAAMLQSWFGLSRVDSNNNPDTANPNATVVDGVGKSDSFLNPSSVGISPSTGLPTTTAVPYVTTTLLGNTRAFTHGGSPSPPNFNDKGWPFVALAVRNGTRRIPHWESWDYHNFNYIYTGFATDATFVQVVVNRNNGNDAAVGFPNSNDITGPDAVWDDGSYYFGVALYVALYTTPFPVIGPPIGGTTTEGFADGVIPQVSFPGGSGAAPTITPASPPVEGGSGGGFSPPGFSRSRVWMT